MIEILDVVVLSIIYGVGVVVTAVALAVFFRRRFGSATLFEDAHYGVFGVLCGVIWPILGLGLVVSLMARAVVATMRGKRWIL